VPRPRLFPTFEGGVQAEWTTPERATTVAFERDDCLYAVAVDIASGKTEEPRLADDPEPIARLLGVL